MKPYDSVTVPLSGVSLIEASAGTGKTYAIAQLVLRLVAEDAAEIGQILVVTFTNAATEELRDRVRRRLRDAARELAAGAARDPVLAAAVERGHRIPDIVRRLGEALRGFDEAPIHTIHGFCTRVLQENAFESGAAFDTELVGDAAALNLELAEDFFRRHTVGLSPHFADHLRGERILPDTFAELARSLRPGRLTVLPPPPSAAEARRSAQKLAALETAWAAAWKRFAAAWTAGRAEAEARLAGAAGQLNAGIYKPEKIAAWFEEVECWVRAGGAGAMPADALKKLGARGIGEKTKKNCTPPKHALFARCDEAADARAPLDGECARRVLEWKLEFLAWLGPERERRNRQRNVQTYDDLLLRVRDALAGPRGAALAAALRQRHRFALMDEFQDTDSVQYEIFHTLFADGERALFLIGDPKQSIYAFRGADIFAYLKAAASTAQSFTLGTNWRSDATLIRALNTLFGRVVKPFLYDGIECPAVAPAPPDPARAALSVRGDGPGALRLWLADRRRFGCEGTKPANKETVAALAAAATAAEIARLAELGRRGAATLGAEPLAAGHMAVLVRTHAQGEVIRAALTAAGIANVLVSEHSVFETEEAASLHAVLCALAQPWSRGLLLGALLTPLLGRTAADLAALGADDAAWDALHVHWQAYHEEWRERGFVRMFRRLLAREGVAARLLGRADGERRLTNLLHLGEQLGAAELEQRRGIAALLQWFSDLRADPGAADAEGAELRLESDARRVRIVTVHKSKGLEYPVVFCPFLWDGNLREGEALYHDPQRDGEPTLDLGSNELDVHRALALREQRAEELRLLYVALTRARHRCYVPWGPVRGGTTSPLGLILHAGAEPDEAARLAACEAKIAAWDEASIGKELAAIAAASGGAFEVCPWPEPAPAAHARGEKPPVLRARACAARAPDPWRVASFSYLVSGRGPPGEPPDYDQFAAAPPTAAARTGRDIHSFPAGPGPGSMIHKVFESFDFRADDAAVRAVVERQLAAFGLDRVWRDVVCGMVRRVLDTPLDAARRLRLADVAPERRLVELQFHFPLARVTPEGLAARLARPPGGAEPAGEADEGAAGPRLVFAPLCGFMKGFMDLVFEAGGRYYLVDYKSNRLGEAGAYGRERLAEEMRVAGYDLQYHIYTVALHRYLAQRLGAAYDYDRHFGGVFYLFVRGMSPETGPDSGVFHDRPSRACVEALSAYFADGEPEEASAPGKKRKPRKERA